MTFERLFGTPPLVRASAPGRVNLIGEHTDYNGGFVLPTVIPQRTIVELAPRRGGAVRAVSLDVGKSVPFEYIVGTESRRGRWTDYLQGITWVLGREGFVVGGADIRIDVDGSARQRPVVERGARDRAAAGRSARRSCCRSTTCRWRCSPSARRTTSSGLRSA